MYCKKCGVFNEDGAKFCGKCGAPLESAENVTQQNNMNYTQPNGGNTAQQNNMNYTQPNVGNATQQNNMNYAQPNRGNTIPPTNVNYAQGNVNQNQPYNNDNSPIVDPGMKKFAILSIVIPSVAIVWYIFIGLSLIYAFLIASLGIYCADRGNGYSKKMSRVGVGLNIALIIFSIIVVILNVISDN